MLSALGKSRVTDWFQARFGRPTPAQSAAWPHLAAGRHTLIVSPTGTGKTLAAFLAVLHDLDQRHAAGQLGESIQALYVSPLRALGYDLEKNLNGPLAEVYEGHSPIRVGLRTGDTTASQRQKQFTQPPHILLTTPESLCLLLSQTKWLPHLQTIRWVIVDEIHALAENKRGSHLSLSLERLEELVAKNVIRDACSVNEAGSTDSAPSAPHASRLTPHVPTRIGLSATVAPLNAIASFLVGAGRACEIVDVSAGKRIELAVFTPLADEPYPASGFSGVRMIRELGRLVRRRRTTLIFTNTRSGAESATFWLREELPELAARIECHHASLDRDLRQEVEDRLKRGELRAVVCSTSLELGIDIGSVDLVVMLASPKGVTRALQRTGRAGHNLRRVSRGLMMATNLNDLVECCATALLARARHLDDIRVPAAPLDVLAQQLVSMGCGRRWGRDEAFTLVRGAGPYRDLTRRDFDDVLDYLAGGGQSLRRQYADVFGKITLDDDGFETRAGTTRRDFLQNIGVIANEGVVRVLLKTRNLGTVEETFARRLQPGDVFMIGGRAVKVSRHGLMEIFVSRADHAAPTVPRWNANKLPLSNRVASEIVGFRQELRARLDAGEPEATVTAWITQRLDCGANNARIIHRTYRAQQRLSEIPTAEFLLVEQFDEPSGAQASRLPVPARRLSSKAKNPVPPRTKGDQPPPPAVPNPAAGLIVARHYFFHSLIGRAANDALARVVALRLSRLRGGNAIATPDDYGFVLTVTPEQSLTADELPALLGADGLAGELETSLARSELLQYHFRNAAQTGLMVYRNYFGEQKSVRKVQFSSEVIFNVLAQHEPEHVLMREARRDAVHTFLDLEGAVTFLRVAATRPIRLRTVTEVPPLSFGMYATKIKEALRVENPAETLERLYHHWWDKIEGAAAAGGTGPSGLRASSS